MVDAGEFYAVGTVLEFQPFLRFWIDDEFGVGLGALRPAVSTLLEILDDAVCCDQIRNCKNARVSTLLEILDTSRDDWHSAQIGRSSFNPS